MSAPPLCSPQPGYIAMKCRRAGEPITIALLGIGVVEGGGTPETDRHVSEQYLALADSANPIADVVDYWQAAVDEHPWMSPHLDVLLVPLRKPQPHTQEHVVHVATELATISMSAAESNAEIDLLGRVSQELIALAHQREKAATYMEPFAAAFSAVIEGVIPGEGKKMYFAWAGVGMAAVGLAMMMRATDQDPQTCTWLLYEAGAMNRAMCAINALAFELGENVKIGDGKEQRRLILASYTNGEPQRASRYQQMLWDAIPEHEKDGSPT